MKALEKAAQDRDKTPAAPPHPVQGAGRELTLEAVDLKPGIKADENTAQVTISPKRAASAPVSHPAPQLTPRTPQLQSPPAGKDTLRANSTSGTSGASSGDPVTCMTT